MVVMDIFEFLDNYLVHDFRTKHFPMMSTSVIPILLSTIYIIVVIFVGPNYMTNKKPFKLKKPLAIYNIGQILACTYLSIEFIKSGPKFGCDPLDVSDNQMTRHVANLVWWTSVLKLTEFIETIFFVLRKKHNQISALHLYHHVTTYLLTWAVARAYPGGVTRLPFVINNIVHMIMYSYYLLSSMGPGIQRKLNNYKKYITIIQMVQFCILIINTVSFLFFDCPIPTSFVLIFVPNVFIVFFMFFQFYRKSYEKKSNLEKLKT